MSVKITGRLPSGKLKERIQQSPQYRDGAFQNISITPMKPEGVSYWKMMRAFFRKHPETEPKQKLPAIKTNLRALPGDEPVLVWFGHSSYLLRVNGKTILVDPVFSGNAAPLSFMVKAFPGSNNYSVADLPEIDCLLLTHDHYDHLDYKTIVQLKKKVKQVVCSLGVSAHLTYWGYDRSVICDLDWWERFEGDGFSLTATPARHFSGRGLKRAQSLWSSFVLEAGACRLFLGGDSGYDTHFAEIGKRFGPFDLAILECGQYNVMWPLIHMMPEETVQAAIDLRAKRLLPVHWAKFRLSMHPWYEPVERVLQAAGEKGMIVRSPLIGEPMQVIADGPDKQWWK